MMAQNATTLVAFHIIHLLIGTKFGTLYVPAYLQRFWNQFKIFEAKTLRWQQQSFNFATQSVFGWNRQLIWSARRNTASSTEKSRPMPQVTFFFNFVTDGFCRHPVVVNLCITFFVQPAETLLLHPSSRMLVGLMGQLASNNRKKWKQPPTSQQTNIPCHAHITPITVNRYG